MKGKKYDSGKLRYDLIDPYALEGLAEVLTFGAQKYADNSWQGLENAKDRYYAALIRHLEARRKGELVDSESGLMHSSHVLANAMFLHYFDKGELDADV